MAEEKKEEKKEEKTAEQPAGHEIPKSFQVKKEHPWEHFKKTGSFKKMQGHGMKHMNRRTGGKGG